MTQENKTQNENSESTENKEQKTEQQTQSQNKTQKTTLGQRIKKSLLTVAIAGSILLGGMMYNNYKSAGSYASTAVNAPEKSGKPAAAQTMQAQREFSSKFSLKKDEKPYFSLGLKQTKPDYSNLEQKLNQDAEKAKQNPGVLYEINAKIGDHVIVVNKKKQESKLYKLDYVLVDETKVSTGINPGEKQRSGDHKTPTGIFDIVSVQKSDSWMHQGRLAYGPYFLRLSTGNWDSQGNYDSDARSSIGMHGTDEPEKLGQLASMGCIRFANKIIQKFVDKGYLGKDSKVAILDDYNQVPFSKQNARWNNDGSSERVVERETKTK
ncbi:MAG: L,D-transpeptidase [Nanoarchaeota archaeon]|nr:L,D-transpeptidase [Nanoarchaeota archaeon]MBU1320719.1 L,D-transpeptidase [Nanoarchaeota archaeon]MBU1598268.1 L,D-transpeptidase [Nanoarchaeota archaeon]MBU2442072.1 L,D-transpeptidase [Nanoarchaeota archaeon]